MEEEKDSCLEFSGADSEEEEENETKNTDISDQSSALKTDSIKLNTSNIMPCIENKPRRGRRRKIYDVNDDPQTIKEKRKKRAIELKLRHLSWSLNQGNKSVSGKRQTKAPERFELVQTKRKSVVENFQGNGEQLGNIGYIFTRLQTANLYTLRLLHRTIYRKQGMFAEKAIQKSVVKFNGFPFDGTHDEIRKRREQLDRVNVSALGVLCDLLALRRASKDVMIDRIIGFLLRPSQKSVEEYIKESMSDKLMQKKVLNQNSPLPFHLPLSPGSQTYLLFPNNVDSKLECSTDEIDASAIVSEITSTPWKKPTYFVEGNGVKLKYIRALATNIYSSSDAFIELLHRILYLNVGEPIAMRRNILEFSGLKCDPGTNDYEYRSKMFSLLPVEQVKLICRVLCLPTWHRSRTLLTDAVMDFLLAPRISVMKKRVPPHFAEEITFSFDTAKPDTVSLPEVKSDEPEEIEIVPDIHIPDECSPTLDNEFNMENEYLGIKLKNFSNVHFQVISTPAAKLSAVHLILYMTTSNQSNVRKNILEFSGYPFDETSTEYGMRRQAMEEMSLDDLKTVAGVFCVSQCIVDESKESLIDAILKFLLKPSALLNSSTIMPTISAAPANRRPVTPKKKISPLPETPESEVKQESPDQTAEEANIREAIEMIKVGKPIRQVGRQLHIPESTLRRKFKEEMNHEPWYGRRTVFSRELEFKFKHTVKDLAKIFYFLTATGVRELAFHFAETMLCKHNFCVKTRTAGKDWLSGFLQRNQDVTLKELEGRNEAGIPLSASESVTVFFNKLHSLMATYPLTPERIYNVDELEIRNIYPPSDKQKVTAVLCCNAAGSYLPPMIIYPRHGDHSPPTVPTTFQKNGPVGAAYAYSDTGSFTKSLFLEWLKHLKKYTDPSHRRPILLLLDNHSSHISIVTHDFCHQNSIHLTCIPPQSTSSFHPLELSLFPPLKSELFGECEIRLLRQEMNEFDVAGLLNKALTKVATPGLAMEGYRLGGIVPLNTELCSSEPDQFIKSELMGEEASDTVITSSSSMDYPSSSVSFANHHPYIPKQKMMDRLPGIMISEVKTLSQDECQANFGCNAISSSNASTKKEKKPDIKQVKTALSNNNIVITPLPTVSIKKEYTSEADEPSSDEVKDAVSITPVSVPYFESDDEDDKPLSKMIGHPNDDQLRQLVIKIMKESKLEDITMKTVIKKVFGTYPNFDLGYRKEFIKSIVRQILSQMDDQRCSVTTTVINI